MKDNRGVPLEIRFREKVNKTEGCWEWTAGKTAAGYGAILAWGAVRLAHRVSYEMANGPIPAGMHIDHICHNTACVNPGHLRAVTRKQNMENRSGSTRASKSGIRGVSWSERDKRWRADVRHNGVTHSAGMYKSAAEAEVAVIAKRNELFTHNNQDRAA